MSANEHTHHIMPLWIYMAVGGALLVLTAITVGAAYIDFTGMTGIPSLNVIIAMIIATIKASLVALFFMHLLFDKKINSAVLLLSLVCLALFVCLTLVDTLRRGDITPLEDGNISPAIIYDESGKPKNKPKHAPEGDH